MLTDLALYYYLIYTPLQFWPCEAETHFAIRSYSLPQHAVTAGIFHKRGKAIIEIETLDAYTQYSTLFGSQLPLSQSITLETGLGGRYTVLKNLTSYFEPAGQITATYEPDDQSLLRISGGYDRGQFIARVEQHYFISNEWSITAGWCHQPHFISALSAQVSYIKKEMGVYWVQQGVYSAIGFSWIQDRYSISVAFGNTRLLANATLNYVP
jgi:hypothetical protein